MGLALSGHSEGGGIRVCRHLAHILNPLTLPPPPLPLNTHTHKHLTPKEHTERRRHCRPIHNPLRGDSWPNKEGKARWAEGQDGANDGAGRQNKRRVDDCRAGHNGGNDGWVK